MDDLLATIRSDQKLVDQKSEYQRLKKEREEREAKKAALRKQKWDGVKKIASKIVAPFAKLWDKIWGFLSTILLGNIITKIIKWMGDKRNQSKIDNIFRFLKDYWPTLLAAYILFGNSLGRFVVGFLAKVGVWVAKSIPMMIKALAAALAKLKAMKWLKLLGGRRGMKIATLTSAAVGTGMILTGNLPSQGNIEEGMVEGEAQFNEGGMVTDDLALLLARLPELGGGGEDTNSLNEQAKVKTLGGPIVDFVSGREEDDGAQRFKQGGVVRGPGGVDKVPARLTAGEFVMSKGAVNKWGANTLASMNAAGGGTNTPTVNYNTGGPVMNNSFPDISLPDTSLKFYSGGGPVSTTFRPSYSSTTSRSSYLTKPSNLIQNFQGGGPVRLAQLRARTKERNESGPQVGDKVTDPMLLADLQKERNMGVNPSPSRKPNVVVNYNKQKEMTTGSKAATGNKIPEFDAEKFISPEKIKTLGISI